MQISFKTTVRTDLPWTNSFWSEGWPATNFWYGNAQESYDDLRSASRWNVNLTLEKNFKIGERYNLSLAA